MEVLLSLFGKHTKIRGRLLMYPRTFCVLCNMCLFRKSITTISVCLYKLFSCSYKISNTDITPFTIYFVTVN